MTKRPEGMRYLRAFRQVKAGPDQYNLEPYPLPRKVPAGRVLAHNHVRHTVDMQQGRNGFRAWTWPEEKKPQNFVRCSCGYAGLPHYAIRDHAQSYRCESEEAIVNINAAGR
jgi:hypothetical protein